MINRYARAALGGLAAAVMALAGLAAPAHAAGEPHRAGLLIVHSGGRVSQRCVEFAEDSIDGLALLQRSGLDLNVDATNSVGVAVCRIDNEGCAFPDQECFCECLGATCVYWSYWRQSPGGDWQYANMGASSGIVRAGDIDAWVWGAGNGAASMLPQVSFDDICVPATPTATPTATVTPPPTVLWYPSETPEPIPTNTATATPVSVVAVSTSPPVATAARPLPSPAAVAPIAAGQNPAGSPAAPTVAVRPAVAFTPMPTAHRGAPVITTPTTFPEQVGEGPEDATPTHPVAAPVPAQEPTTLTPAALAQVIPTVVAEPSSTPTFLLGNTQRATATPTPQRAPHEAPGRLPIPGMILAGVGACGVVALLLLKRESP